MTSGDAEQMAAGAASGDGGVCARCHGVGVYKLEGEPFTRICGCTFPRYITAREAREIAREEATNSVTGLAADQKLLIRAFLELNSIRARDGAPPGVSHESFSRLVDDIDSRVKEQTGHTAHCHPWLYGKQVEADLAAAGIDMQPAYDRMHGMIEARRERAKNLLSYPTTARRIDMGWMNELNSFLKELIGE